MYSLKWQMPTRTASYSNLALFHIISFKKKNDSNAAALHIELRGEWRELYVK